MRTKFELSGAIDCGKKFDMTELSSVAAVCMVCIFSKLKNLIKHTKTFFIKRVDTDTGQRQLFAHCFLSLTRQLEVSKTQKMIGVGSMTGQGVTDKRTNA